MFGRRYGRQFEALYVGKALNLRSRIRSQLKGNVALMCHVKGAKAGKRVVVIARAVTKPGQRIKKVLAIIERAFIKHFLAEGHDLVNKQGTRIRRHVIASSGKQGVGSRVDDVR